MSSGVLALHVIVCHVFTSRAASQHNATGWCPTRLPVFGPEVRACLEGPASGPAWERTATYVQVLLQLRPAIEQLQALTTGSHVDSLQQVHIWDALA